MDEALKLLKEAYNMIGMAKYELGEEWDPGKDFSLEGRIGEFIHNYEITNDLNNENK